MKILLIIFIFANVFGLFFMYSAGKMNKKWDKDLNIDQ